MAVCRDSFMGVQEVFVPVRNNYGDCQHNGWIAHVVDRRSVVRVLLQSMFLCSTQTILKLTKSVSLIVYYLIITNNKSNI